MTKYHTYCITPSYWCAAQYMHVHTYLIL